MALGVLFSLAIAYAPEGIYRYQDHLEAKEAIWSACAQTRGYNSYRECVAFAEDALALGMASHHDIYEVVRRWLTPEEFIETDTSDPYQYPLYECREGNA